MQHLCENNVYIKFPILQLKLNLCASWQETELCLSANSLKKIFLKNNIHRQFSCTPDRKSRQTFFCNANLYRKFPTRILCTENFLWECNIYVRIMCTEKFLQEWVVFMRIICTENFLQEWVVFVRIMCTESFLWGWNRPVTEKFLYFLKE